MSNDKFSVLQEGAYPLVCKGLLQLIVFEHKLDVLSETKNCRQGVVLANELEPDVIIFDINMRGMGGYETPKLIRDDRIISYLETLTVSGPNEEVINAISLGTDGFWLRHSGPDYLLAQTKKTIHRKIVLSVAANSALCYIIRFLVEKLVSGTANLISRRLGILELFAKEFSYMLIASEQDISARTFKLNVGSPLKKLYLLSRLEAAVRMECFQGKQV